MDDHEDITALQPVQHGFHIAIGEVHIENGGINFIAIDDIYCLPDGADRTENGSVRILDSRGDIEGDENLVFHHQYPPLSKIIHHLSRCLPF